MTPFTHNSLLGLQEVVKIDDLWLLPRIQLPSIAESMALVQNGMLDAGTSSLAQCSLTNVLLERQNQYADEMATSGVEQPWISQLPISQQKWLRHFYATQECEPLAIVPSLPYSGLSYMIHEDGLCHELCRVFELWRLGLVKQLGFLQAPWVAMLEQNMVTPLTTLTRLLHSYDVMAIATLIGVNTGLSGEALNTLRTAGLTHDWLTPAGGDSVKLIDPDAFDEDANYGPALKTRLNRDEWSACKKKWHINEQLLIDTVLGNGLLGEILDIADKLAYIARDIETCLGVIVQPSDDDAYVGTRALAEIVRQHPYVCSLWDSVRVMNNQVVFTDSERLVAFLKTRVVLFREVYYHPRARFGEYLISRILVKKLYADGTLNRDRLLAMVDGDLERELDTAFGSSRVTRALSLKSHVQSFETREEAEVFRSGLKASGISFSILEDHRILRKTGERFHVLTKTGPRTLREAHPGDAQELFEMANMLPSVHVYWLSKEESQIATVLASAQHS